MIFISIVSVQIHSRGLNNNSLWEYNQKCYRDVIKPTLNGFMLVLSCNKEGFGRKQKA